MPNFLREAVDLFRRKDTVPVNTFEGFQSNGAIVPRDRRGTLKAEIPGISEKSETLGNDPLAIYKPSGAKQVDAAKAMANFTGWTLAVVDAIASEVANIQLRLCSNGVNEHMTGPELKYVTMAHLRWPETATGSSMA
jgi:hypothetical protein